jgi:hypothetical protein
MKKRKAKKQGRKQAPSKAGPPASLPIALGALADLAVEWWRLDRWADSEKLVGRHVARRVARFLEENGFEVVDLTGKPYEAGLAVEVVDTLDDPEIPEGESRIDETVSPIVMWKGTVVKQGQIVMRRRAA